jgi:hypothetical protein
MISYSPSSTVPSKGVTSMKLKHLYLAVSVIALFVAGCSSLPGLRVLTGEDSGQANAARVVEQMDLVMADKTGATEPSLIAAADRIEAAAGNIDVIEIRHDLENDTFVVNMLVLFPEVPQTLEGQVMLIDTERRAFELTWQAVLPESQGADKIRIALLNPISVSTLDSGASYVAQYIEAGEISREDALTYLSGERNVSNFYGLVVNGVLNFQAADQAMLYDGSPNHPMFMIRPDQEQQ